MSGGMHKRDGFAELSPLDQPNMARRAALFSGVKLGAEYAGMRPMRHTLHLDPSTAPPGAKVVYLLRHGEGVHNAWRHLEQAAGRTPTAKRHNRQSVPAGLHDPVLTSQGLADAAAAAELARALPRPRLCVCSPMRRTAQTLLAAFGDAVAEGVPVIAHELCREAFHGRDPSLYDSRLSADELSSAFPQVDFHTHVLPAEERSAEAGGEPSCIGDPLWWHCVSPYARSADSAGGIDEAAIGEHAYRFLCWLMARPERVVAVTSHANFLLALHHACLDGCAAAPQVFHTGELRAIAISQSEIEGILQSEIKVISQSEVKHKVALALGDAAPAPRSAGGAVAPTASTRAAWADRLSSITFPLVMATPATSERDSS